MSTIPFVGSKRRDVPRILPLLGSATTLVSPFCGTVALEIEALEQGRFTRAILGDASPHVMAVLRGIQKSPGGVAKEQERVAREIGGDVERLKFFQREIGDALELEADPVHIAGMLLGASCWTFSRLWNRVNQDGGLNTPCDPRGRPAIKLDVLERYQRALKRAELRHAPWTWMLDTPPGGVVILCDPPYLGPGGFTAYTAAGWREADAQALGDCLAGLTSCRIVLCEQTPGGGPIYHDRMGFARELCIHSRPIVRNVRGDQQSKPRAEVVIVAPADRRLR